MEANTPGVQSERIIRNVEEGVEEKSQDENRDSKR